jgi:UDP-3-O-[3-hydroxymyristoyl] glucosamine N-acyltransferase
MKLGELSKRLNCKLVGDPEVEIRGISEIQTAKEGDITFLTNPRYRKFLRESKASAVILGAEVPGLKMSQLVCDEPYVALAKAVALFYPEIHPEFKVSERAVVASSAKLGSECYIGDYAFVGENTVIGERVRIFPHVYIGSNCVVGDDTVIFPHVTVYDGTRIGKRVRIHAGAVIGSDGFGFAFSRREKKFYKIPQRGNVIVEDDVEIGANTTIDRGTIGSTIIGEGSKIDNLVQIGHNVKVGKFCTVVSQVGISGSARLGNFVTLAGKVGVAGHIEIADRVTVAAKAGVTKNIKKAGTYAGFPARPHKEWRKIQALIDRLPELYERVKRFIR